MKFVVTMFWVTALTALPTHATTSEVTEEILVTGSHIKRATLEGPMPVVVFTHDDLEVSGVNTLGDFARYLPFNALTDNEGTTVGRPSRGTAQINLRGIGIDNTLTLLNGRRVAPYGAALGTAEPFVDIASIPVSVIERIEILKDGASAIYGADAVAGVVNIVLKDTVDGIELGGDALSTTEGDQTEARLRILGGWSRGSIRAISSLSYFKRDELPSRARDFSADADLTANGGFNERSPASAPPTIFLRDEFRPVPDPQCPTAGPVNSVNVVVPGFVELCTFNFQSRTSSISSSERWSYYGAVDHDLASSTNVRAEAFVSLNDGESTFAGAQTSAPLLGTITGFPIARADHPNNPFAQDVEVSFRIPETGDRVFDFDATNYRLVLGASGFAQRFDWEVSVASSGSTTKTRIENQVLAQAFQAALFGNGGPSQDLYYNPFGLTPTNDPDLVRSFLTTRKRRATAREHVVDALINWPLFDLGGGTVVVAGGLQYRSGSIEERQDPFSARGEVFGSAPNDTLDEDRTVAAAFLEMQLPLHSRLETQLAVRHERYNDFGSSTNPKLALRWDITDDVALRASFATAFRPPAFRELFDDGPAGVAFFTDSKRCPLTGDPADCGIFPYSARSVGNEDLTTEDGTSRFVGAVWQVNAPVDAHATIDFWEIDHDDRVIFVPGQTFIDDFNVDTPFVSRLPPTAAEAAAGIPGRIDLVLTAPINADRVTTNGLDVVLGVVLPSPLGELTVDLLYTYLNDWVIRESLAAGFSENRAGSHQLPRHRGNFDVGLRWGASSLSATLHYVGRYRSEQGIVVQGRETDQPSVVKDWASVDVQYRRSFSGLRGAQLALGCQNCGDRPPPRYNNTFTGRNLHDGRGALLYLRWTQPL